MPTHPIRRKGKIVGYQWGHHGKIYKGPGAERKAGIQGAAIKISQSRRFTVHKRRKDGVVQRYHVVAHKVVKRLKPFSKRIEVAGSIRRKQKPSDVDIVLIPKDKEAIKKEMEKMGKVKSSGDQQIFSDINGVPVDIFFSEDKEFGAQLLSRTGPAGAAIANRVVAREKGMKLSQHGLFNAKTGKRIPGTETEAGIYKKLGKEYRAPEHRGDKRTIHEIHSARGKSNRAKGLRFEFKILNKMKKQFPDTSFRSAGSHGTIDLLVREPNKYRIIAARTNNYLSPKERKVLEKFDKPYEQVEIWSKPSPKKIKKTIFKKAEESK